MKLLKVEGGVERAEQLEKGRSIKNALEDGWWVWD